MKLRRGRESNARARICSPLPNNSATSPRETLLVVTRAKGTEAEAELVLIERDEFQVHLLLDDGERLSFNAEEFDLA